MPLFITRKEVFVWLTSGSKNIEVRKGLPRKGDTAMFLCGANSLKCKIVKKETGRLAEVINQENFQAIIPTAQNVNEALDYLRAIYGTCEGTYTAYHLGPRSKPLN